MLNNIITFGKYSLHYFLSTHSQKSTETDLNSLETFDKKEHEEEEDYMHWNI